MGGGPHHPRQQQRARQQQVSMVAPRVHLMMIMQHRSRWCRWLTQPSGACGCRGGALATRAPTYLPAAAVPAVPGRTSNRRTPVPPAAASTAQTHARLCVPAQPLHPPCVCTRSKAPAPRSPRQRVVVVDVDGAHVVARVRAALAVALCAGHRGPPGRAGGGRAAGAGQRDDDDDVKRGAGRALRRTGSSRAGHRL